MVLALVAEWLHTVLAVLVKSHVLLMLRVLFEIRLILHLDCVMA